MFEPEDPPRRLKEARLALGLSQAEMARFVGMQQKDISLHESKTSKSLIPLRYLAFLQSRGIDLNSIFEPGPIRMIGSVQNSLPAYRYKIEEQVDPNSGNRTVSLVKHSTKTAQPGITPDELEELRALLRHDMQARLLRVEQEVERLKKKH